MQLIRKKGKRKYIAFFLTTIISFCFCNRNPVGSQNNKKMKLEIIPSTEVSIKWADSTLYQHNSHWNSYLATSAYDSLANLLKNSKILIEDMWCPNEDMHCKIPQPRSGLEIIIKLKRPDTSIYKYGFQKDSLGFPINCFRVWRHYKYTYN